jgi:methionyl-tRNA formyltransferase
MMQKKKIVFLGSKPIGYHCFAYLLQQQEALGYEVIGLLSRQRKEFGQDNNLFDLATEYHIPIINNLSALPQCHILYSVQYHEILDATHINKASQAAYNLHMAPLPEYRGSNQFSYALIDGKTEFGTTIHIMDPGIDHGDILFQKRFPIPENCWVDDLYNLTYNASLKLFTQTLKHLINGNYTPISQASLIPKYGTSLHFKKDIEKLKHIDLGLNKEMLERYIRATAMPGFQPPYCIIDGQKVYFTTQCP